MVVVLMGVSGAGKTTVGELLAAAMDARFVEGDAFHPRKNVEKMRTGTPLTDADRQPWLEALSQAIGEWLASGETVVLACSALRQRYREILHAGRDGVRFVHLKGSEDLIRRRLEARRGHYMPPSLLDSQFAALEEPQDALTIDVTPPPATIVAQILRRLRTGDAG